jgi:classical protein kinase C/novel protein kinase C epsilon type
MPSPLGTPSSGITMTTPATTSTTDTDTTTTTTTLTPIATDSIPLQDSYQWLTLADDCISPTSTSSPLTPSPLVVQSPSSIHNPTLNDTAGENNNNNDSTDTEPVLLDSSTLASKFHSKKKYTNLGKQQKKVCWGGCYLARTNIHFFILLYTVDLLKADTPINRAKVSLKLHDLEYKVDVEKKVQMGIKNLAQTVNPHSSAMTEKKIKSEIQEKQAESNEKMALLASAVRKYKGLYLGEEEDGDDLGDVQGGGQEDSLGKYFGKKKQKKNGTNV